MAKNALQERIQRIEGRRVLVAPLSWGLGHATRCVPIIRALQAAGKQVVIASDGYPLEFLRQEFPQLEFVEFPWSRVEYSPGRSQVWAMLRQVPKFLMAIRREHRELPRIIEEYKIETVISDNRFGLWSDSIKSIYMTHQISVKVTKKDSLLNYTLYRLHRRIIERYAECWVPDFEGKESLSGDLSHRYPLPKNTYFIGILSRFQRKVE